MARKKDSRRAGGAGREPVPDASSLLRLISLRAPLQGGTLAKIRH